MKRLRSAASTVLIALLLAACRAAEPTTAGLTLLDPAGGQHGGVLAGGCRIEVEAPVIHSGHFTPFEAGDPFVFEVSGAVEGLTLEMRPFDADSGLPGDPVISQALPGPARQISLALNADPGWYILAATVDLPGDDCAVYWFPVGVSS